MAETFPPSSPPFNSCFLCVFILSCVASIYPPLPLFIYSVLCICCTLLQSFPVINIAICASTNAAQNRLLMP